MLGEREILNIYSYTLENPKDTKQNKKRDLIQSLSTHLSSPPSPKEKNKTKCIGKFAFHHLL